MTAARTESVPATVDPRRRYPDRPVTDDESDAVLVVAVNDLVTLRSPMWHGDAGAVLNALGCITTAQVSAIDGEQWDQRRVAEIMEPCSEDNTVAPETDTLEAMTKMQRNGRSPLLVVSRGQLLGILSLRDLLELLTLRLEIEGGRRQRDARLQAG